MQIFDTHCHYNLEPLYSGQAQYFAQDKLKPIKNMSWQDHWQQAQGKGVVASLIPGTSIRSSKRAITLAKTDKNFFASAALHPSSAMDFSSQQLEKKFEQLTTLAANPQVTAVGETGLDYVHLKSEKKEQVIKQQQQLFIKHIQLSNQLHKPLIIHARDQKNQNQVYDDILSILQQNYNFKQPFVLHCASGTTTYIQAALKLGAYVSFAGNITYPNAQDLRALFKLVPEDKLLIETDAPFLTPQSHRGQINQPWMIASTAQFIQEKFNANLAQILDNSYRFYQLDMHQL